MTKEAKKFKARKVESLSNRKIARRLFQTLLPILVAVSYFLL